MTCDQARRLMNGDKVRQGESVGQVEMPKRPSAWFTVRWEHGTETRHQIDAPHSVAELEAVRD